MESLPCRAFFEWIWAHQTWWAYPTPWVQIAVNLQLAHLLLNINNLLTTDLHGTVNQSKQKVPAILVVDSSASVKNTMLFLGSIPRYTSNQDEIHRDSPCSILWSVWQWPLCRSSANEMRWNSTGTWYSQCNFADYSSPSLRVDWYIMKASSNLTSSHSAWSTFRRCPPNETPSKILNLMGYHNACHPNQLRFDWHSMISNCSGEDNPTVFVFQHLCESHR